MSLSIYSAEQLAEIKALSAAGDIQHQITVALDAELKLLQNAFDAQQKKADSTPGHDDSYEFKLALFRMEGAAKACQASRAAFEQLYNAFNDARDPDGLADS